MIPSSGLLSLLARRASRRAKVLPQYRAADETMMWDVMPANSNMIIPWVWQNCTHILACPCIDHSGVKNKAYESLWC